MYVFLVFSDSTDGFLAFVKDRDRMANTETVWITIRWMMYVEEPDIRFPPFGQHLTLSRTVWPAPIGSMHQEELRSLIIP